MGPARGDDCIGQLAGANALRGVCDADGLGVHADKEGARVSLGRLDDKRPLATAQVEVHALVLARVGMGIGLLERCLQRITGMRPVSGQMLRVRLDGASVAFQALFKYKVLRRANMR